MFIVVKFSRYFGRFSKEIFQKLKTLGHVIEKVGDFEEIMGHAGAIVNNPNGCIEGAFDLRSDGAAIGE